MHGQLPLDGRRRRHVAGYHVGRSYPSDLGRGRRLVKNEAGLRRNNDATRIE